MPLDAKPQLVLASTSRYRKALLERLDVEFQTASPQFDERAHDDAFATTDDATFALQLAEGKARSLVDLHPDAIILAADQIATLDLPPRTLLHKPADPDRAVGQLMLLRGRTHALTTGVVMLDARTGRLETAVDTHQLTMRDFSEEECRAYVARYAPLDSVGAYRIEDAGIRLFESVQGADATAIVGLPLIAVCRLLRAFELLPS